MLTPQTIQAIKELIEVCKQTRNYKKLAKIAYKLIFNKVNEMGIRLGFNPIKNFHKKQNFQQIIFTYLNTIENILFDNFNISIFSKSLLSKLKHLETLYYKAIAYDKFELTHIRALFEILFKLDALQLPNLHKKLSKENIDNLGNINLYSTLFNKGNNGSTKENSNSFMSELITYNLHQRQNQLERKLRQKYDPETVENLLLLKQMQKSYDKSSGKIQIKGTLAESITFKRSFPLLYGYFILSFVILFFGLGIIIIGNGLFNPSVFGALSTFLLLFFGAGAFFLFIYWNYFMRNGGS